MSLSQGIALFGIVIAVILLLGLKFLDSRIQSPLNKFLRLSGLVYLSCTVVMYLLILYQPVLSLFYAILAESLALGIHILSSMMLIVFSKKLAEKADKEKSDSTEDRQSSSDIETK